MGIQDKLRVSEERRATKPKFVAQSRPELPVSQQLSSIAMRENLITQGEKYETSTQNLQRNKVARQVEGFGISAYFAALTKVSTVLNILLRVEKLVNFYLL